MIRKLPLLAAAPLLAALAISPVRAASDGDSELRLIVSADHDLGNGLSLDIGAQLRLTEDMSRVGLLRFQGGLGVALAPGIAAEIGYDHSRQLPEGRDPYAVHRFTEALNYVLIRDGGLRLDGRTRLEQMLFSNSSERRHRLRQRLRLSVPLAGEGRLRGVVYGEAWVSLKGRPGAGSGIEQWRGYAGLALPVARGSTLQTGYMHKIDMAGRNRANHIVEVSLSTGF